MVINSPAFLCLWETGELSWIPLLALGSDLIDACFWANRLLFSNPVKTLSSGTNSLLYPPGREHLTVADLFSFYQAPANKDTVIGVIRDNKFIWNFPAANLKGFIFPGMSVEMQALALECRRFAKLPDAERSIPQRDHESKQRAQRYMKDNGLITNPSSKGKEPALYAKRLDEILAAAAPSRGRSASATATRAVTAVNADKEVDQQLRLNAYQIRFLRRESQPAGKAPAQWCGPGPSR